MMPALNKLIEQHAADITPEFSTIVASVISRSEEQAGGKPAGEEAQMLEKLQVIYRAHPEVFDEEKLELNKKLPQV